MLLQRYLLAFMGGILALGDDNGHRSHEFNSDFIKKTGVQCPICFHIGPYKRNMVISSSKALILQMKTL